MDGLTLPKKIKDNFEICYSDLRDKNSLLLASKKCKIFYNLGALISIPIHIELESFVQTNVLGTLNLLEIARQAEVDLFVQTSTSEVYGSAKFVPMSEDHPLSGQSPYSASKIASDQFAYSFNLLLTTCYNFKTIQYLWSKTISKSDNTYNYISINK